MNFRTISDLNKTINDNLHRIPQDIDIVVGVPRSGMLAASIISLLLNLPLSDLESFIRGELYTNGNTKHNSKWVNSIEEAKKVLVVEDSSQSGRSMIETKEKLKKSGFKDKIIYLIIYVTYKTVCYADLYFEICNSPRMFEWNYLHHSGLMNVCFDIDGVLCVDPTENENDDGKRYKIFLQNAILRVRPTAAIGYLITSRLEKYRADTEDWLKKNGILYHHLIMMPLQTKEERLASGSHGKFKAEYYSKLKDTNLFIESEESQAEEIAFLTKKAVYCVGNQKFYDESNSYKRKAERRYKFNNKIVKIAKWIFPQKIREFLKKYVLKI